MASGVIKDILSNVPQIKRITLGSNSVNVKITGTTINQLFLIFGLSATSDDYVYLSILYKQNSHGNVGYMRNFGGNPCDSVTYSGDSYEITLNNVKSYSTLVILSPKNFTVQ